MKRTFITLLLPAGLYLPAVAQQGTWRVSAEAGSTILSIAKTQGVAPFQNFDTDQSHVNPTLVLQLSRQTNPAGKWRIGLRGEITSWKISKGYTTLGFVGQLTNGNTAYLGWPALSLAPTLYYRILGGRSELGISGYAGIAWGSGRKYSYDATTLRSTYFSASTGFQSGIAAHYNYRLSNHFSVSASAGAQRSWMTLVDDNDATFQLNGLPLTLGAMYRF